MASIVKRKSKFSVVYNYTDENGGKRQRWETFPTNAEAKKRKAQIEFEQSTGTFIPPVAKTLRELLEEYISIYGVNTWALSTYESRRGLIDNYINPIIGDMQLDALNPHVMDRFYRDLLKVRAKPRPYQPDKVDYLSPRTVKEIHKILRNAFNQAVKWELISKNPVVNATLPKCEAKPRDIWTAETLFHALEVCDDDNLSLALNLAFSCSLRMGEMLALTWDCIDISQESIHAGTASIYVNKELQRVQRQSLDALDGKGVIKIFPAILQSRHTALVLKEPKTKTSVRKVFLPKTVAEMLIARKEEQGEMKELFGDEYANYDLVFCSPLGTPIEGQVINRALNKLITDNNFPKVVFHSLRHSSITYKLKLNGGDMKSVQDDSGHAQIKMVADVYSHIIDDDRRLNAQRFEEAFYSGHQTDAPLEKEMVETEQTADAENSEQELLTRLLKNPQMATLLKTLAQTL
ncbi:MAG: site-specific integrase [Lachnospiraceae bacterium]|nr:site-specific integrase [Lachnospiraceae bacterium]